MAKTKKQPTFNEVLSTLGNERFDVSPAGEGANRAAGATSNLSLPSVDSTSLKVGCFFVFAIEAHKLFSPRLSSSPGPRVPLD